MLELHTPVQYVKGIGPRLAEILASKGVSTVEDLLYYLPFRYEDRINPRRISELREGEVASLIGEVRASGLFRTRRMPLFQLTVGDPPNGNASEIPAAIPGFGRLRRATLKCLWFHGAFLQDKFRPGQLVALYGKVEADRRGRELQLINPQFEILAEPAPDLTPGGAGEEARENGGRETPPELPASLEIGRIVPIYESAGHGKITSRWFRRVIHGALENLAPEIPDGVPAAICRRLGLVSRREAFWKAHWPPESESFQNLQAARTPAHKRLIFEELFFLELGLELKRKRLRAQPGIAFRLDEGVRQAIKRILPFHPTAAQKRVLKEIADDMKQSAPMRRLLQGDVGSGKTIVALQAAIIAIENGYQVAIMAPTEILATQHYLSARRILDEAGYRIVLLTGSLEAGHKREIRRHIAQGSAQLMIGTHALIEEKVEFANLGLVVVDEQHRFGVMQRLRLMKKALVEDNGAEGKRENARNHPGEVAAAEAGGGPSRVAAEAGETNRAEGAAAPDVLVMTATPIPRTLALTLYGDLDVSILDEMPPGRSPIVTRRMPDERAGEVWDFLRKQVKAGHQAFVVYPVIDESKDKELKAAIKMYDELRQRVFSDLRIGLLHGRMEAEEKDAVMRRFQRGEVEVLVSTTVIEVGVDVPNANLMVVEHAERFGLSQLHQLRGRIGRGPAKSYCVLMTGGKVSPEAEQRLQAMERTTNGFAIAELDLELRGPGEFFGTRQAGMPGFRVASLLRDRELLEAARREAAGLVAGTHGEVGKNDMARALTHLRAHWQRRYGLVEAG